MNSIVRSKKMKDHERKIYEKMKKDGMGEEFINDFLNKVRQVESGETGIVSWEEVGDLNPNTDEIPLEKVQEQYPIDPQTLKKLVVIKLNGGLGTSMGLSKAKSLIPIKGNLSFLNVIAQQILYLRNKFSVSIPLLFMDSYNTQKDSLEELKKIGFHQENVNIPLSFLQHRVPRLLKDTLEPIECQDKREEWCPPGHGDIYFTLVETGLLDKLIDLGYEVAFLSNGDNLGATVEPSIANFILKEKIEFAMEMTPKTPADKKGGAIYRKLKNGVFQHYELLETAQVPAEHMHEFTGMGKFRTFSTNNLWIHLPSLKKKWLEGNFQLALIVNPKVVEGKDVIQLETAMGSAVRNFSKFKGIIIPRDRFAPVKKTEDYLVRRSDAYQLNEDYSLTMSIERKKAGLGEPLILLDEKFYKKIQDFDNRFIILPSLLYCQELVIEGDWIFDAEVSFHGKCILRNKKGSQTKISSLGKVEFHNEEIVIE